MIRRLFAILPLINEVFHISYPEEVKITQLHNEHQQEDGEITRLYQQILKDASNYMKNTISKKDANTCGNKADRDSQKTPGDV